MVLLPANAACHDCPQTQLPPQAACTPTACRRASLTPAITFLVRAAFPTGLLPALSYQSCPPAAITLFEVFLRILETNSDPSEPFPSVWGTIPLIIGETLK